MTIRFECQFCGKTLKADDSKAGKKVKCPACEGLLTIPEPQSEVQNEPEVYDAEDATSEDDGVEDWEPESSSKTIPCPACGEDRPRKAKVCPYCGDGPKGKKKKKKFPLATPGKRFLGALVDSLAAMVSMGPGFVLIVASGDDNDSPMAGIGLLLLLLGLMVLMVAQIYLMVTRSQSIGKVLLKTQVYDYEERVPAGFVKTIILRNVVSGFISALPCIGHIYSLVDPLMVFSEEHRCLHDQIAGTYVVDIS